MTLLFKRVVSTTALLGLAASALCQAQPASTGSGQAASTGSGQVWPTKPIRMLVGFPAGGPTDVVARIVSEKASQQMGQQVVVDNRPGAAGNIAVEILTRAAGDGHTLLYSSNAIAVSPGLYSKLPYDPLKDITPVTEIGAGCLILSCIPRCRLKVPRSLLPMPRRVRDK